MRLFKSLKKNRGLFAKKKGCNDWCKARKGRGTATTPNLRKILR